MKLIFGPAFFICLLACRNSKNNEPAHILQLPETKADSSGTKTYEQLKQDIIARKQQFSADFSSQIDIATKENRHELTNYWVHTISNDLYNQWKNTPWDFNGTTTKPQEGSIACGFFVTTILQDMDVKINRTKLAICASSVMMKNLTPHQRIKNLSNLSYPAFNDTLISYGKGVYIIGLDYHTGFIVNDGKEAWFIHSNYIGRKGVTKELVMYSAALKSSKTRWMISLTGDVDFLRNWLNG